MDPDESSIERLKRSLYSRNEKIVPHEKRTPVSPHDIEVPTDWGKPPSFNLSSEASMKKNNSFFNKFLFGSLGFFIVSLGIALFIFFGGINMISSNNVDIKIISPSSISSGEDLLANLTIVNGNRTDLEEATLFIEYPQGSIDASDQTKVLTHDRIDIGTIPKGGTKDYSVRALLFGEKDVIKTFTLRIEYKVKGSNATFSKEKKFDVVIGSSPILLNIDYPKEVNSGQDVTLNIKFTSNSSVILSNSLVKVEYPYGFTYKSSSIKPLRDNSIWNIGDLKNGDEKTLTITGVLIGQNQEDRSFRISAGTETSSNPPDFDTPLSESSITIGIRKSFFDLQVIPPNNVSIPGQSIPITIKWQNTLPDKIINSHIEASISGNAFDRSSVSVGSGGFYQSVNNTVMWDRGSTIALAEMLPGDNGEVSLSPTSFQNNPQSRSIKNPHIDLHVVMTGDRSGPNEDPVSSSADVTIKILSTLALSARSNRNVGPFSNTGPIPPKADQESTYTITWTLTNTTNDLKDTNVTAILPAGVVWKGETSPVSERIAFNPDTKVITWNVGNISAGAGFTYSSREVSFKVGLTPSINQISSSPDLVSQIRVDANDTYVGVPISLNISPITTQYSDPTFKTGDNIVVK